MLSVALPGPILALLVGALIMIVVVGALFLSFAVHHHQHGEHTRPGDVLAAAAILLAVTYGVGWAALRFL